MHAMSHIQGSTLAPGLTGMVYFMDVPGGADVYVEVIGLPLYKPGTDKTNPIGPHGFHLHENPNCEINDPTNPFTKAGGHFNPTDQPHGNHSGDFPVLFSNNGYARMMFFTNKFKVSDIIDKSVVIHENPDDYRTDPAGDAGKRIGCGVIKHSIYPLRPYF